MFYILIMLLASQLQLLSWQNSKAAAAFVSSHRIINELEAKLSAGEFIGWLSSINPGPNLHF